MTLLVSDRRGRVTEHHPAPTPPTWGELLNRVIRTVEVSAAAEAKASLSGAIGMSNPNGARQQAAYRHWERVGEVMNATRSVARLVGKVPLVARQAMISDSGAMVYEASDLLPAHEWIRGFGTGVGGQAELAERFASELFVGGEAVIIGWNDENYGGQWRALSPLALQLRTPGWVTIEDGSREPLRLTTDEIVWGHCRESKLGRESGLPWSGVMAAAHVCDTIMCLDRLLGVIAQVNLSPGLLLVPAEVQPPPVATAPDGTQKVPSLLEWFTNSLDKAITSAVEHPRTSAELVPTVATVPGERAGEFRHLTFERKYDERVLQVRTILADLLLVFLDVEARAVDGSLVESKYVNGELVRRSLVDSYITPYCARFAALATGFLQQYLQLIGLAWENQVVRPDETALEPPPDSEVVLAAVDAGIIGPHGARSFFRFPEEWAPEAATAVPAEVDAPVDAPAEAPGAVDANVAAAATNPDLSKRAAMGTVHAAATRPTQDERSIARPLRSINDADRRLAADIAVAISTAATEAARAVVRRGRDQARKRGAPLEHVDSTSLVALGIDVEDVVARTVADRSTALRQRVEIAQRKVLGALAALGAAQIDPADLDEWITSALSGFDAATRSAIAAALEELGPDEDLATVEPDESIVRTIASLAGGGSGVLAFVAGLVGSRIVASGLESAGVTPHWQWVHSGNPNDFPPHADLDGVEFASWDDPVLDSAGSGFEWVGEAFSPTNGPSGPDHNGCGCVAVLVEGGSP